MTGLTGRQRALLNYLIGYFEGAGCWPTIREMAAGLEIGSSNAVHDHLQALQRKGYATCTKGKARSWRAIRDDQGRRIRPVFSLRLVDANERAVVELAGGRRDG